MRRAALAGGALVLVLGVVAVVLPFLTRERDLLTTTPQPPPLTKQALVELRAGQEACTRDAVIDERSERALIRVGTYGRPASPLRLTITGPGLREMRQVAPTYADSRAFAVPVDPPDRAVAATICLRNDGVERIALYAADDRITRLTTRVDGEPVEPTFEIAFAEAERHTLLERLPLAIERMQSFRPDAPWLAWLVGVLFVLGMPLAVVWAFAAAVHADEERGRPGTQGDTLDAR